MPATFRAPRQGGNTPLFDSPVAQIVREAACGAHANKKAVATPGQVLFGVVEEFCDELWLRIHLACDNPLRTKLGLHVCYALVGGQSGKQRPPGSALWTGPTRMKSVQSLLDLQWPCPFPRSWAATYTVEMRSKESQEAEWDVVYTTAVNEAFPHARVSVSLIWPLQARAASLRIVATGGPWQLTSASILVHHGEEPSETATSAEYVGSHRAAMLRRAVPCELSPVPFSPASTQKRIVHFPRPSQIRLRRHRFKKVLVMGLYHTCTTALSTEIARRFDVEVVNVQHGKQEFCWKHRVHRKRPAELDDYTLAVLLVKDPRFWVKSLARNFYDVHPVIRDEANSLSDSLTRHVDDLFGEVEYDQVVFPNVLSLWSAAAASYFNDAIYPPELSVMVRAEDFLFRYDSVMDELKTVGLKERRPGVRLTPRADPMKVHSRSRREALDFYSSSSNRNHGWTAEQLRAFEEGIDPRIADFLHYGPHAVRSWTLGEVSRPAAVARRPAIRSASAPATPRSRLPSPRSHALAPHVLHQHTAEAGVLTPRSEARIRRHAVARRHPRLAPVAEEQQQERGAASWLVTPGSPAVRDHVPREMADVCLARRWLVFPPDTAAAGSAFAETNPVGAQAIAREVVRVLLRRCCQHYSGQSNGPRTRLAELEGSSRSKASSRPKIPRLKLPAVGGG